jgi:AraC-like DNA-binding protein
LNNYLRDVHETPSEVFSELVAQPDSEFHFELPYLSSDMQVALYQMNHNIYQGILRELYIESKSMELIAHFFAQVKRTFTPVKKLRRNELDLVYEASNILQDNLETPPSVLELSRIIGLNEYKLRLGFKILFNSTVYEYLRKQRMNKARLLLEMKEITIAEAGYAVGYSNLSHFAAAFKKEFGINPSQYIANK